MIPIRLAIASVAFLCLDLAIAVNNYDGLPKIPYCGSLPQGCCRGREDHCSAPIIGTLCYCDEFCDRDHNEDCCPDFRPVCRGEPTAPETLFEKTCSFRGQTVTYKNSVKENCRTCTCVKIDEENVKMECEIKTCVIEENIVNTVNQLINTYGWRARNYTEYWGKGLDEGLKWRLGTLQPDRFVRRMIPVKKIYDPYSLPKQFDAYEKWRGELISPIQDQGWCGSSWAISTAAIASDRFAIVSQGLERIQLSSQNLLSCNNRGQQSCSGGYLDKAWLFLRKYGLVNEACYPYSGQEESCRIPKAGNLLSSGCVPPRNVDRKEKYKTGPAYRIGNETDIMYEILESGPVQATIKVYHDFFSYESGIYRHTDLSIEDRTGYHSVRIVGWGQETDYTGRIHKFWKVANSWGRQWGENGYFRIARGDNECEIESFVLAAWPLTIDPVSKNDVFGV